MTPAQALQFLLLAAKDEHVMLTKTAQVRLLYLADLRAHRYGVLEISGVTWERAAHGPFSRAVGLLARKVEVDLENPAPYQAHAMAVVKAYARLSNEDLGSVCKGTAPMRKAPRPGDRLDLDAVSTNDTSAAVTDPAAIGRTWASRR